MNEINLCVLLENCIGSKLWTDAWGEVELIKIDQSSPMFQITVRPTGSRFVVHEQYLTKYGANYPDLPCILFPSKDERDWTKFSKIDQEIAKAEKELQNLKDRVKLVEYRIELLKQEKQKEQEG
jgi:hypothetical protein